MLHLPSLYTTGVICTINTIARVLMARYRCGLATGLRRRVSAKLGVVVEARLAVRAKYGVDTQGSALRNSEASSPQRFQCLALALALALALSGKFNPGSGTVRSRAVSALGRVRFSEVSQYSRCCACTGSSRIAVLRCWECACDAGVYFWLSLAVSEARGCLLRALLL